jgi:hypothetical protein
MKIITGELSNSTPYRIDIKIDGHEIVIRSSPVLDFTNGRTIVENELVRLGKQTKSLFFGRDARDKIRTIKNQIAQYGDAGFLYGEVVLQRSDGEEYKQTITFQNEGEFPRKGSHIIIAEDNVPVKELDAKGYREAMGIPKDVPLGNFISDEEGIWRHTLPAACEVDGRLYINTRTEPFVHPVIQKFFEGATRV